MNQAQKIALNIYFKNFKKLINYADFLTTKAKESKFWRFLFYLNYQGVIKNFYYAADLNESEVESLVNTKREIIKAECICGNIDSKNACGNCYYFDDAAKIYSTNKVCDSKNITLADFRNDLTAIKDDNRIFFMTPSQDFWFPFFPKEYVLCFCDKKVCRPWRYQQQFADYHIIKKWQQNQKNSLLALVKFFIIFPIFLLTYFYYLFTIKTVAFKNFIYFILIMAMAVISGLIISLPIMWQYLHSPTWQLNHYWYLLLPLGAVQEIVVIYFLITAILSLLKKTISKDDRLLIVFKAFLFFQSVQLIRFLTAFSLNNYLSNKIVRLIFWSFDPLAWIGLVVILFLGIKYHSKKY